ncbi:unnamed protein product [Owenia fusiformis]|uniref:Uncharacterized protein n=1 Tax=Owenia fusiformis TaxID=6347 RepID=A0A8J1XZT1_OWEFU|nr:unnamed protein product [Owenia fusiformis]
MFNVSFNDADLESDGSAAETYVVMGMLIFLSVVGTSGNIIVIRVFSTGKDHLTSVFFILVLAVTDLFTCVVIMPFTVYMEYVKYNTDSDFICKFYHMVITSNIPFSAFIMAAISVDRYLCICQPFTKYMTTFKAKVVTGCLAVLSLALSIIPVLSESVYHLEYANTTDNKPHKTPYNGSLHDHTSPTTESFLTSTGKVRNSSHVGQRKLVLNNVGHCNVTSLIVPTDVRIAYRKLYTAIFLASVLVVLIMYIMIYVFIVRRRSRYSANRPSTLESTSYGKRKGSKATVDTTTKNGDDITAENEQEQKLIDSKISSTHASPDDQSKKLSGNRNTSPGKGTGEVLKEKTYKPHLSNGRHVSIALPMVVNNTVSHQFSVEDDRPTVCISCMPMDRHTRANIKLAIMLFVVVVVFLIFYIPAFMMSLFIIDINKVVFYMYFAHNVANPIIYAYMNTNFRDEARRLFASRCQNSRQQRF